jgi:hypothetical protein
LTAPDSLATRTGADAGADAGLTFECIGRLDMDLAAMLAGDPLGDPDEPEASLGDLKTKRKGETEGRGMGMHGWRTPLYLHQAVRVDFRGFRRRNYLVIGTMFA